MNRYTCSIECVAAGMAVYLNEYLLYHSNEASHHFSTNLAPWMETQNSFRIRVFPSGGAKAGEPVHFSVLVERSDAKRNRTAIAQMSFPAGIAAPDLATFPFDTAGKKLVEGQTLSFTCEPQDIVPKPWQQAKRSIEDPAEVFALYADIQKSIVARDVDGLMRLSAARIAFIAAFNGRDPAAQAKSAREDFADALSGGTQWKTYADPPRDLTLHEYLPGKVVRVLDLHGHPPLRTLPDPQGIQFGYDVIIAITPEGLRWIM